MLKEKIQDDTKQAMRDHAEVRLSTLRLLSASLKNYEIEKGLNYEATDEDVLLIVSREIKKRKEAIESYKGAGRDEAAAKEEQELQILTQYQPEQMGDEELEIIVRNAIEQTGATSMRDMGKVMGVVIAKVEGKADGGRISEMVKNLLN